MPALASSRRELPWLGCAVRAARSSAMPWLFPRRVALQLLASSRPAAQGPSLCPLPLCAVLHLCPVTQLLVLRASRDAAPTVWGALSLVRTVKRVRVGVRVLQLLGSTRTLRADALSWWAKATRLLPQTAEAAAAAKLATAAAGAALSTDALPAPSRARRAELRRRTPEGADGRVAVAPMCSSGPAPRPGASSSSTAAAAAAAVGGADSALGDAGLRATETSARSKHTSGSSRRRRRRDARRRHEAGAAARRGVGTSHSAIAREVVAALSARPDPALAAAWSAAPAQLADEDAGVDE